MEREKAAELKAEQDDTMDRAMESWEHSRIKVGYGPSNGSKFSDYHS
jgi:hypothetical protein